jgi:hypothetical protein
MRSQNLPLYAIALAVLIVGLVFAGVPVSTLFVGLALLACPLMMIFMMGGMHGGGSDKNSGDSAEHDRDHRPTSSRP